QQGVFGQARIDALRNRHQAEPVGVRVGQGDVQGAGRAQGDAHGHADDHQDDEEPEQQGGDHDCPQARRRMPARRRVMIADSTGSHMEYHQVGTPMAGDVSPQLYSSRAMRPSSTVRPAKNSRDTAPAARAKRRRRSGLPPSASSSMRMGSRRTKAEELALMVRTISRKMEISSVQAKDSEVR